MKSYRDYFYPGTQTLQNLLGIRSPEALAVAEAELTRHRARDSIEGMSWSADGLRAIHHHLFQDIYPWAGEFRTVDMVKLPGPGQAPVRFSPGAYIARVEIPRFCGELYHDMEIGRSFDGLDAKTFGYRAAVYMADLNYIHPFPEGNGRTQRILLEQMAARAGYRLDHYRIQREAWIAAAIDSHGQNASGRGPLGSHAKMTALIAAAVEPLIGHLTDHRSPAHSFKDND